MNFIGKLFIGPGKRREPRAETGYKSQIELLRKVWNAEAFASSYGIERLFLLLLILLQFAFPLLLIRSLFSRIGSTAVRLAVESYTLFKLFLPVGILAGGLYQAPFFVWLVCFTLIETLVHLLGLVFLPGPESNPDYRRSILLLLINYFQVSLDFAVLYLALEPLNRPLSPVSAVYFSFVTGTTLGYGEYYPATAAGRFVVTFHLVVFVFFLILFVNHFLTRSKE